MRRTYVFALTAALLCAGCSGESDEQPAPDPIAPPTAPLRQQDQVEQDMLAMLEEIEGSISDIAPGIEWQERDDYNDGISCNQENSMDDVAFQSPALRTLHFPDHDEWQQWMEAVGSIAEGYGYRVPDEVPDREDQNRVAYYNNAGDALRVSSSVHSGFVVDVLTECIPGAGVQS
ncbi:LppA family lipoprotein [Dietzia timorensis]|uniref:Lipoprotein LppJ n=1 Tax=Dietzia timorensis TaxID=499555 RepID=A0A173LJX3_9ACTN|nr:LppA family lipoprotein [Dietzia timorensis]ANI92193.1 Hypothetical protein BJL86_1411 [Dietzia timorensis]